MDFAKTIEQLRGGLVVSCQAPEGSPLDRPEIIAAFAAAAERAGAVGVRTNRPANIRAVRAVVRIPVIGICKQKRPGEDVYITRDFQAAEAVAEAGADIIALDATPRRPGGYDAVARLIGAIRGDLRLPVMADISSVEEAAEAAGAGADLVATTLFGYTAETHGRRLPALGLVRRLARVLAIPVICEGGIASAEHVAAAFKAGAYAVVVGAALTGIEARVKQFAAAAPRRPCGRQ